ELIAVVHDAEVVRFLQERVTATVIQAGVVSDLVQEGSRFTAYLRADGIRVAGQVGVPAEGDDEVVSGHLRNPGGLEAGRMAAGRRRAGGAVGAGVAGVEVREDGVR